MGAWSHEPFGNDDAVDWSYGLEKSKDLQLIEATLDKIVNAKEYVEAPDSSEAIGAVEVLAKLLGKGTQSDAYTEQIDDWVNTMKIKPNPALLTKANLALDRILGSDSELRDLWEETGEDDWENSIAKLKLAIGA